MGTESFMNEQVGQYIDLSGHIDFAELIVKKYDWGSKTKQRLVSQLNHIHNKQNDKFLNLSVVGEFSTGKSSFINALLGENLLVSSTIQGTTVVNTIIEYYDFPVLYVLKKDETYDVVNVGSIAELSNMLSDITTNPETARNIKYVRVGIPSELLAKNIRIIDTPGTNSIESWHEEVTKDALNNLSDLSIILTDALHPLPQTLLDFVEENMADIYLQSAFVVTYYDKIRKSERNDVIKYIETKLAAELEINNPQVFPYVAPAVISDKMGETAMKEQAEMVRISAQSKEKLISLMMKNRQISQIKKLLALTKEAFDILQTGMSSKKDKLEKEYKLLLKTKQILLEPFVESEKKRCISEFAHRTDDIKDNLIKNLGIWIAVAKENINKHIMSCKETNAERIKTFVSSVVPTECELQVKIIVDQSLCIYQSVNTDFSSVLKSYQRAFKKEFDKMNVLKIDFENLTLSNPDIVNVSLDNFKGTINYMTKMVSEENWKVGGGGAVGAAVGTAIMPGAGTIIGGLIGMFFGVMGTPSPDEIKSSICASVSKQLDSVFHSVETDIISTYNKNITLYKNAIITEIDKYLVKYKSEVDNRILKQNLLIEKNKNLCEWISNDLNLILLRRNQLQSISDSLNKLM